MLYPFYFDPTYLLLIPALLLSLWAQIRVSGTFNRYSKVPSRSGLTATDMAQRLLHAEGIYDVSVERVRGNLTDHYDPKNMVLRLSDSTSNSTSIAALGVAAHEAGHVLQHRDGYGPLMLRTAAVPMANIGSMLSWAAVSVGTDHELGAASLCGNRPVLPGGAVLSDHAAGGIQRLQARAGDPGKPGIFGRRGIVGARKVLSAAALTYVAAAFMAIMQLLRLLVLAGNRRD